MPKERSHDRGLSLRRESWPRLAFAFASASPPAEAKPTRRSMIRLAIRRPIAVSMAYLAVALLGVAAWRNIPIELLPDTQLPRLSVEAQLPGSSPEATEALLTAPLEAAAQQVAGVDSVTSVSSESQGAGQTDITIEFTRRTDMQFARMQLSERLGALESQLPPGTVGPFIQPYVPKAFEAQQKPLLGYTVTGPYTLEALRANVDEVIAPRLRQVPGVAAVRAQGGRARVIQIELDGDRIQALGLSPERVRRAVQALNFVQEAGAVESGGQRETLTVQDRGQSVSDILRLPVLSDRGRIVRVSDVARVHDTFEAPTSYYRIDGQPAIAFSVVRQVGSNAIATADRVKRRIAALAPGEPPGVHVILDQDQSATIRKQLTDLRYRAIVSAVVIFLVLLLFLRSFRSTAIVFATIGFSILITLNLLYFFGYTLNVLTLMGLAMGFGLIVDNAIVVLENIYRRRRRGESAEHAAEHGAREVVLAVLAATLTTVVVLIPFVYMQGELRAYYMPLAFAVGFALLASLAVAFSFIPALAARMLKRDGAVAVAPAGGGGGASATSAPPLYQRIYAGLVGSTLRHPWVTVAVAVLCLAGSYHLFDKYVTRGVVWGAWANQDTYIDIQIRQPRGEQLARTDQLTRYFERRLAELPQVKRFVSRVKPRAADITVTFPDSLNRTGVPVAIKEQMVAFSHLFGGADVRVYGYGPSFYGGGGAPPNYAIRLFGYNYQQLRGIAEDLGRRLTRFSRIRDVDTNSSGSFFDTSPATELVMHFNRQRLAMHGLTVRGVVYFVGAATQGRTRATRLQLGGQDVRLSVKLRGSHVLDLQQLRDLLVPAPDGQGVRLGDVATVDEEPVLNRIVRSNQEYERVVAYEFQGPVKLGDRVRDAVVAATALPPGYSIQKEAQWTLSSGQRREFYEVLAVALALVFMVTAALFESLRQPLCVLLAVPMALVGVFLVFFYTGATFTREAYVGVVMMGGIVVNNAILLIDHINNLRRRDGLALELATLRGTLERVRPILMTTATSIFGLLPLVLFSPSADSNIWNALGYSLIGGLASSTVLVLTVTPALYLLFERRGERRRVEAVAEGGGTVEIELQ